jgi:hypothetical protein
MKVKFWNIVTGKVDILSVDETLLVRHHKKQLSENSKNVTMVFNGTILDDDISLKDYDIKDGCTIIYRLTQEIAQKQTDEALRTPDSPQNPQNPQNSETPETPETPETHPTAAQEMPYNVTYSGKDLLRAYHNSGQVGLILINRLANANPFYLSLLVRDPVLAEKELIEMMKSSDFSMSIRCADETADPIRRVLMTPDMFAIDEANIKYIHETVNQDVERYRVKEVYLFCDRDVGKTVKYIEEGRSASFVS